jgi:protein-tyrosine phosphatase
MAGYVDIHAHLLPGIDDGPIDLAESMAMAIAAVRCGITTVVATPHLRADFPAVSAQELARRRQEVQDAIDRRGIELRVLCGAEVSLAWAIGATDADLRLASYRQNGTDLLIETPADVSTLERFVFELQLRRYRITLAHPERCRQFQRDPKPLEALTERGVLLEINAGALLLPSRSATRKLAEHLCRDGFAHAVASDAHSAGNRRPVTAFEAGLEAASALVGPERAQWLVSTAPRAIVDGKPLPPAPDVRRRRRSPRHRSDTMGEPRPAAAASASTPERRDRTRQSMLLIPLVAVAIVSFVIVRSQQGSGAALVAQQRDSRSLAPAAVERVVNAAPNPETHRAAIHTTCIPLGNGELNNPWRCVLSYRAGHRVEYEVEIFADGTYLGLNQVVLAPGPPRRSAGSIEGCCITIS